jgi:Flp pilus assembly protein TadD
MDNYIRRAILLIEQNRFPDAEKELIKALAADPEEALAYALLGECLIQQDKGKDALEMAKQALNYDASNPYHHSVLAKAYWSLKDYKNALTAIEAAIEIEPYDSHFYYLRGNIAYAQRNWDFALRNAEKALEINPENVAAINLRSMALVNLNRKEEASETADYALHKNPENPHSHANKGWAELEKGNHKEAQGHFREALRLAPMNEMATWGLKESIKSENFLYKMILTYFLWIAKMNERNQWAFIIGLYIIYRVTLWAAETYPVLAPFLYPIVFIYIIFAFSTWIAMPVSNLFLQLHPLGKYALSDEERLAYRLVGGLLASAIIFLSLYFAGMGDLFMVLGGYFGLMALPTGGMFGAKKGTKGRRILTMMTLGIAISGLLGIFVYEGLLVVALLGIFAFGWVANSFAMRS